MEGAGQEGGAGPVQAELEGGGVAYEWRGRGLSEGRGLKARGGA